MSEWVTDDTLTVRFQIELRADKGWNCCAIDTMLNIPPSDISAQFLATFEGGQNADVLFLVEGERMKAHSLILSTRSEVFNKQLNSGMLESASYQINVKDCDAATFRVFLQFLYTDDLKVVETTLKEPCTQCIRKLLAVSHKYQASRLQLWCEDQLSNLIDVEDVCVVLCQAYLYEAKQLQEVCLSFIKHHKDAVMTTSSFVTLSQEWPLVLLNISRYIADVPEVRCHERDVSNVSKRKREE